MRTFAGCDQPFHQRKKITTTIQEKGFTKFDHPVSCRSTWLVIAAPLGELNEINLGELNEIKTELKRLDALNVANQSNDR